MTNKCEITGTVHIWDLPDQIYVGFEKKYKEQLRRAIKYKYSSLTNFAHEINEPLDNHRRCNTLIHFFECHKISLALLKKIVKHISDVFPEFSMQAIERNVYHLGLERGGEIVNPKLPFNFVSRDGVRLIAAFLHDGGISKDFIPNYRNLNPKLVNGVTTSVKKVVGGISPYNQDSLVKFPAILGVVLNTLGMKVGPKIFTNPEIPDFIKNGCTNNMKAIFLRQAFDDDGSPIRYDRQITIGFNIDVTTHGKDKIPQLLLDDKKLLEDLGIAPSGPYLAVESKIIQNGKKFKRRRWIISIYGRTNLESYSKKIGFAHEEKQKKLENMIKSYKVRQLPKGSIPYLVLKCSSDFSHTKGFFTIKQVSIRANRSYHQIKRVVWRLQREKYIEKISENRGVYPAHYKLAERGWKAIQKERLSKRLLGAKS